MKRCFFSFLFLLSFVFSVSAQNEEAKPIDDFFFGKIPCGDFQLQMDIILQTLQNSPDSKIYVYYYGGRYRREPSHWNQKKRKYEKVKLKYPHSDDGLNWAKAIPLFFENYIPLRKYRDFVRDKIVLKDGGYSEETHVVIWLVPKNGKLPESTPEIDKSVIEFKAKAPYSTPNFACCYKAC